MSVLVTVNYTEEKRAIHSHFHDGYQLIYVAKGSARVTVSGKQYEAKAGTLVLIGRLESHEITDESADYCRYTVQIAPQITAYSGLLGEKLFSLLTNRPGQFRHAVDMGDTLQPLFRQMLEETEKGEYLQKEMLVFLLCQLLVLCCRAYPMQVPEDSRRLSLVLRVQRYLEENMAQPITLEALAEKFHLSQSYLSHLFKGITGSSVMGYLNAHRLQAAKGLLAGTEHPIGRILEECGFTDGSNFSRSFKQATGLSPSRFRKKYKV